MSFRRLYLSLLVARLAFSLFGTGYIHPDEYFQNGEVMAGAVLGLHALKTWEWEASSAVRSVVPPFFTTGIPFYIAKTILEDIPGPVALFYIQRLVFFVLSLLLDFSVALIVPSPAARRKALLLLSTSHVVYTFQPRPFSNSVEAVMLALSLAAYHQYEKERILNNGGSSPGRTQGGKSGPHLYHLAVLFLFTIGVFTRPAFVAFALPIAIQLLLSTWICVYGDPRALQLWISAIGPLAASALTASLMILSDTYFFGGALTITPWNFLKYNTSARNLGEHGLHPRWLHLFVNLPMIVGPALLSVGFAAGWECLRRDWDGSARKKDDGGVTSVLARTCVYVIVCSITLLSIMPHQEPRFLVPLLVPLVVLVASHSPAQRLGNLFWTTCILFNLGSTILFGILHQGGVVPSLLYLGSRVLSGKLGPSTKVIYWKTYMPPRHLLGIPEHAVTDGSIALVDLAGLSASEMPYKLGSIASSSVATTGATRHWFLVTPPQAYARLPPSVSQCFTLEHRVGPHLDLDNIAESIEVGWKDGLSLGVYVGDGDCIAQSRPGDGE